MAGRAMTVALAAALLLPAHNGLALMQPRVLTGGYDVSWNHSSPNGGIGHAGTSAAYSAKGDSTFRDGMPLGNGDMVALA